MSACTFYPDVTTLLRARGGNEVGSCEIHTQNFHALLDQSLIYSHISVRSDFYFNILSIQQADGFPWWYYLCRKCKWFVYILCFLCTSSTSWHGTVASLTPNFGIKFHKPSSTASAIMELKDALLRRNIPSPVLYVMIRWLWPVAVQALATR